MITLDANEAVASVAHRTNEVIVLYPITPSSPMGEWCDEWSAHHRPNIWNTVPQITEMQSEGGAIAAVHGALQAGSLATTLPPPGGRGLRTVRPARRLVGTALTHHLPPGGERAAAASGDGQK